MVTKDTAPRRLLKWQVIARETGKDAGMWRNGETQTDGQEGLNGENLSKDAAITEPDQELS
jgi:hypothetical protein